MKYFLAFAICAFLATGLDCGAQGRIPKDDNPAARVSKVVKNLSVKQRRQIDAISNESSSNIKIMKSQLNALRDSIHFYMNKKEDNSTILMPLFDREAVLQLRINKEMYRMKVRLDEVLTEQQYVVLTNYSKTHDRPPKGAPKKK
jgi:hypothetical protein